MNNFPYAHIAHCHRVTLNATAGAEAEADIISANKLAVTDV